MALDKRWMEIKDKSHPEYKKGVDTFLKFAFGASGVGDRIRCPCNKCRNVTFKRRGEVKADLVKNGIYKNYTEWHLHGEEVEDLLKSNSMKNNDSPNDGNSVGRDDLLGSNLIKQELSGLGPNDGSGPQEQKVEAANFRKLLERAEQKVYPGHEKSNLSCIVGLVNFKCSNNLSDEFFDLLLKFLKSVLTEGNSLPDNCNEAEKIVEDLLRFGASASTQPPTRVNFNFFK
jgi:hypothetical protein